MGQVDEIDIFRRQIIKDDTDGLLLEIFLPEKAVILLDDIAHFMVKHFRNGYIVANYPESHYLD